MISKSIFAVLVIGTLFQFQSSLPSAHEFKQILSKQANSVEYNELNSGNYKIKYPSNLPQNFQSQIANIYGQDQDLDVCDDAEVEIIYHVELFNEQLLSIRKTTSIFNCYAVAVDYDEYINLISFDNKLYSIGVDESNLNREATIFHNSSLECEQDNSDLNIFFCDGKVFIKEFMGKLCQKESEVDVDVNFMRFTEI